MRFGVLACALAFVGCVQQSAVDCGDYTCPPQDVCVVNGCATQGEVDACVGLTEGAACTTPTGSRGSCQGGACRTGLCGNGVVDSGEACDDGNATSGDGCRADCGKLEVCGDAILDDGEACDDGNDNAADACDACRATQWTAQAIVGSPFLATESELSSVGGLAIDSAGRIYIADTSNGLVRRIDPDGTIVTVAGGSTGNASGDGGPATSARLQSPTAVAIDGIGRVVIAEAGLNRIRRVDNFGIITTIAGTGFSGFSGDNGPGTAAQINGPLGVTVDALGRVCFSDSGNFRIRCIGLDGLISTLAGSTRGFLDAAGTGAQFDQPAGLVFDAQGNLYVADMLNDRVRRIANDPSHTVTTVSGTGTAGANGDGGPATSAQLNFPRGIAMDTSGALYVADSVNSRIRKIVVGGMISTVAGTSQGFQGDGGSAITARLANAYGVAIDASGRMVIADTGNLRIRRVDTSGVITTIGGNGSLGTGDSKLLATVRSLAGSRDVVIDGMGRLVIADTTRVWRTELDGTLTRLAGTGTGNFSGDGGPAVNAQFGGATSVAIDSAGRVAISDFQYPTVRRIDSAGVITTIAGTATNGYNGDGGQATAALLNSPHGIAYDPTGRLVIADTLNHRVRRVEADGTIVTIAGTGVVGSTGDGLQATSATLNTPYAIAFEASGRMLIADFSAARIRAVDTGGVITTIAGTGTPGFFGDGGAATAAQLSSPADVAVDPSGAILIVDQGNRRIRRIIGTTIDTIAGIGPGVGNGDGALATAAVLQNIHGVAADTNAFYIATEDLSGIRKIDKTTGIITTTVGRIDAGSPGPVARARFADPKALVVSPSVTYVAGGAAGVVEQIAAGTVSVVGGRYPQTPPVGALFRYRGLYGDVGGIAFDAAARKLYVSSSQHVIDVVDTTTGTSTALAGAQFSAGFFDGPAAAARFRSPTGLYLDGTHLYVADAGNHAIRVIDLTTNMVSTIANTAGRLGFSGDSSAATAASLFSPNAITICHGDVFIADTGNQRVRRIDATGMISTVLGTGVGDSSGEGEPAQFFPVDRPAGLACDAYGNLFVTSSTTIRMLAANTNHVVDGSGSVLTVYGAPPRTMFPASETQCLTGIAATSQTNLQVLDACSGLLVELTRQNAP